jgi:hypothetical protein
MGKAYPRPHLFPQGSNLQGREVRNALESRENIFFIPAQTAIIGCMPKSSQKLRYSKSPSPLQTCSYLLYKS